VEARREWLWRVVLALGGVISALALVIVVVALFFRRAGTGLIVIPPQDCGRVQFVVSGTVMDSSGNPVAEAEILLHNNRSQYSRCFSEMMVTNAGGRFSSGTHAMYACDELQMVINADGFEEQTLTYKPPSGYDWPDELPDDLTIVLEAAHD
jgi:hypothetical protein